RAVRAPQPAFLVGRNRRRWRDRLNATGRRRAAEAGSVQVRNGGAGRPPRAATGGWGQAPAAHPRRQSRHRCLRGNDGRPPGVPQRRRRRMTADLAGRRILLGGTGGTAAYQAAHLASRLVQAGAQVQVVMTEAAARFVTPLTFEALTGRRVLTDLFGPQELGHVDHVELAHWAEAVVVAPATANVIGKLAAGIADDALTTVLLGTAAPILLAPAMESRMYLNPAVQDNLRTLASRGVRIAEPGEGHLASGRRGPGRMAEPDALLALVGELLAPDRSL